MLFSNMFMALHCNIFMAPHGNAVMLLHNNISMSLHSNISMALHSNIAMELFHCKISMMLHRYKYMISNVMLKDFFHTYNNGTLISSHRQLHII